MITTPPHVEQAVLQAEQMLQDGIQSQQILTHLVHTAEATAGDGAVCSILLLDKNGLLRNGASPQLPQDYLAAIDGLQPHPNVGTCAAAAATGEMVVTVDFYADNKWAELRHLPLALGFYGAWSMPIKNDEGKVLGTFGTYYREKREPSEKEIAAMQQLVQAVARVLN